MTYPPQPPSDPYGQQYPPPPPPPGYGQQQYPPPPPPPNPYPQQPPYPQQQPYGQFGQYPGGMPPQPPRNNQGKILLIVVGAAVVIGLVVGGIVWYNAANAPRNTTVSVGTTTARTPSTATTRSAPTTTRDTGSGGTGAAGSGKDTAEDVLAAYITAVNGHQPTDALALTCPKSHDELASAINGPDNIFSPGAQVVAAPGKVTENGTGADMTGHYSGMLNGKSFNRDFTLPLERISGRWFLCDH